MEPVKKYIMMPGLENNQPAHLTPLQEAVAPYALGIVALWWLVWGITIFYIAGKFVILPFFKKIRG